MPVSLHKLKPDAHYTILRGDFVQDIERRTQDIQNGRSDPRTCLKFNFVDHLQLAGIALIFKEGDAAVAQHFKEAARTARQWLSAPSKRDASPNGFRDGWEIGIYSDALDALVAFGSPEDVRAAAAVPEVFYRNPEIIAEEAFFSIVRSQKAWLLGDDATARRECEKAIKEAKHPSFAANAAAFQAIFTCDASAFATSIIDVLKMHKRHVSRYAIYPMNVFSVRALALVRMARTCGMEGPAKPEPYLPVRFLADGLIRAA